jgi:hypothetical protein
MSADLNIEVVGVKQAIRSLNKIEPGLRKQFQAEVTQIAQPAIVEAQRRYTGLGVPLSGMAYKWTSKGRQLFPYNPAKAVKGVKVKLEGDRRATATIVIIQSDAGTAAFESAGRANPNRLGDSLGALAAGRTRIIGPAVYSKSGQIARGIYEASLKVVERVNRELQ